MRRRPSMFSVHAILTLAYVLAAAPGSQAARTQDALSASLRTCATLEEGAERLDCYDRVVAQLEDDATAAVPAAEPSPAPPEERFGLVLRQEGAAQPKSITARVTAVREQADGTTLIELDNGQTWRRVDEGRPLLLRSGDTVTISRAALGSFRLSTPTRRFARVRRVH